MVYFIPVEKQAVLAQFFNIAANQRVIFLKVKVQLTHNQMNLVQMITIRGIAPQFYNDWTKPKLSRHKNEIHDSTDVYESVGCESKME